MYRIKRWPSVRRLGEALIVLVILSITFFAYRGIFSAFFQQDEWWGYGQYILNQGGSVKEVISYFFAPSVGHYTPLTLIVLYGLFSFGMNYFLFASVSLALHLFSVILVYCLAKQVFKEVKLAAFAALLFGLSASAYQGTAWVAADIATHGATIFGLLSSIFFFRLLNNHERKNLYLSLVFLFISILFKEISVGLLILFPLLVVMFDHGDKKDKITHMIPFVFIGLVYLLLRGSMFFLPAANSSSIFQSQASEKIISNMAIIPTEAISRSLLPENIIRIFSGKIIPFLNPRLIPEKGTTGYSLFTEGLMQTTSFLISLFLLISSLYLYIKNKKESQVKIMVFGLIWIILNSFILAFAPEKKGVITTIDSRYLYFISIGSSFFIVSFVHLVFKNIKLELSILLILVVCNFIWLDRQLLQEIKPAVIRKEILTSIQKNYPRLSQKTLFYTESDSSYFGLPAEERIMPFQSGFGLTLLDWYEKTEKFPKSFFENEFLWKITDQGYRSQNDRGFGYFRDFNKLTKTIEDEKLLPESVISFRYDSESQILTNNTTEIRGRLEGYFSNKRKLQPRDISIIAGPNLGKTSLMQDGRRDTFWDSKLPYAEPQYIQIQFADLKKVAAISIDSYKNKDQNEVGYAVYLSKDGKTWKEVFYSRRYPPRENGIIYLYFKPELSRFVKIEQKGYHKYADWVIAELTIYETAN